VIREKFFGRSERPTAIRIVGACLLVALGLSSSAAGFPDNQSQTGVATVLGTWTGTSLCVGSRPACKDEQVVYRILPVEGSSTRVTMLADKIIDGQRVPMGRLEFQYKDADQSLTCEFTRGSTHGLWSFTVSGNTMTGTGVIQPDKTLVRRVSVHRVKDSELPKAPRPDEYDGH